MFLESLILIIIFYGVRNLLICLYIIRIQLKRNTKIIYIIDKNNRYNSYFAYYCKLLFLHDIIYDINDCHKIIDVLRRFNNCEIDIIIESYGGNAYENDVLILALIEHDNINTHVINYASSAASMISITGNLHMDKYAHITPFDVTIYYNKKYIQAFNLIQY